MMDPALAVRFNEENIMSNKVSAITGVFDDTTGALKSISRDCGGASTGTPTPIAALSAAQQAAIDAGGSSVVVNSSGVLVDKNLSPVSGGAALQGKFVLAGDSFSDICGGLRPNGTVADIMANSWFWWANAAAGAPLGPSDWVNAGVTGNTTADLLVRWNADVAAQAPKGIHLLIGTNNFNSTTTGTIAADVAVAKTDLLALIAKAKALTPLVIVGTLPGRGVAWGATSAQREATALTNAWLRSISVTYGFELADYSAALVDPATSGSPINDSASPVSDANAVTTDGLHWNGAGSCIAGTRVLAPIIKRLMRAQRQITAIVGDPQLLPNPTLRGASGSSAPTGWNIQSPTGGAVLHSYDARTDGVYGDWLVNTLPTTSRQLYKLFAQIVPPNLTIGTKYEMRCEYSFEYLATDDESHLGASITTQNSSFADISRDHVNQPSNWTSTSSVSVKKPGQIGGGVLNVIGTIVAGSAYLTVMLTYGAKARVKFGAITLIKLPV